MRYILIGFILAATGCAGERQPSSFPISYDTDDSPEEAKIYIRYVNEEKQDVCLYPTNWPGSDGRIDSGKDRVFITVAGKRYTTVDFDSGYCPGCVLNVHPGDEVVGFFNYEDFGLPPSEYRKGKALDFSPMGTYCPSRMRNR